MGQNAGAMILGVGVDMAEVSRIREAIERHGERFLRRIFTSEEIAYCSSLHAAHERFAARFAAKEAAMKALGTGWREGIGWQEIEVVRLPSGQPILQLRGKALEAYRKMGGERIALSLTHTDHYALAEVIIEGTGPVGR